MLDHQRMQYHLESFELVDDYTISLAVFIKRKQVKVEHIGIHSSGKFSGETFFKRFGHVVLMPYITDEGPRVRNV